MNLLEQLANDFDVVVRRGIASNENIPIYLLEKLTTDSDHSISSTARKKLQYRR